MGVPCKQLHSYDYSGPYAAFTGAVNFYREVDRMVNTKMWKFITPPWENEPQLTAALVHPSRVRAQEGRETQSWRKPAAESLQDRNSEVLGPPPPEIHVNRGPAFAHRNHPTLDQRKTASRGQHSGGVIGVEQVIIRTRPKAKLSAPRRAFASEEFGGAAAIADPGGNPGQPRGNQIPLYRAFDSIAHGRSKADDPAVAVGFLQFRLPEHDFGADEQAGERIARRRTGHRRAGLLRQRQSRNFDRGQADLAAVIEHEGAPIDDAAGGAAREHLAAARHRRPRSLLRRCAETSAYRRTSGRKARGQGPIPPPDHRH